MDKYGLGYEELSKDNPGLVYLSVSGFGHEELLPSPLSSQAGYGPIAEAYSGVTNALLAQGGSGSPGFTLGDISTSLFATIGLLAAPLRHRERTGEGQFIDVAQADCHLCGGRVPVHVEDSGRCGQRRADCGPEAPLDRVFNTRDGHIYFVVLNGRHWREVR